MIPLTRLKLIIEQSYPIFLQDIDRLIERKASLKKRDLPYLLHIEESLSIKLAAIRLMIKIAAKDKL